MDKDEIVMRVAESIRIERFRRHLTQEELAEKAKISTKYLNMIENRKSIPSIVIVINICHALGIDLNTLVK